MFSRSFILKPLLAAFWALAPVVFLSSCADEDTTANTNALAIRFQVPAGFPPPVYSFQNNPLTQDGFELGRALFYDPILSRDSTISCGSCHQQFVAFANSEHRVSHGIDDLIGTRNSPGLFNLAWHPEFMWDGGVNHLEVQPLAPITNPIEMDESIQQVVTKLQRNAAYRSRFLKAFGTDSITTQLTMRAMAQFMGAMVSANARYDRFRNGLLTLDEAELRGLQLFRSHCASCHQEPLMSDFTYRMA
jgi:cytochrome c peroxidase